MARLLMFQGTGSDVGKSMLVAGLCRLFTEQGLRVRPFKPQNMSNNAAVTADCGEIGRAQALQARACRVPPTVHMNPVLLKPQSETGAQIIVQGQMRGSAGARDYQAIKSGLMPAVLESLAILRRDADLVLVEGAGSASEVNLRQNDIANMGFAAAADAPVILIGDIDRGGVIASLVGTGAVAEPQDAARIKGFIVNKMRGDISLFADGMRFIEQRTGWAPLGLVPWFEAAHRLPAEDVLGLMGSATGGSGERLRIAVPVLPRLSNFDDLDPLRLEPRVELLLLRNGAPLPAPVDLVILPGSKATIADLEQLRAAGYEADLRAHWRRGGRILGLCGGYQMLGRTIADPDGIEGPPGEVPGLGFLHIHTRLGGLKSLRSVAGHTLADNAPFSAYEMHVGITTGADTARPFARFDDGRPDGAGSADGRVAGTYLHGLFGHDAQRDAWLTRLGASPSGFDYEATVEATLDALAVHLNKHIDIARLLSLATG